METLPQSRLDERIAQLKGPRDETDERLDKLQPGLAQRTRDYLLFLALVDEAKQRGITFQVQEVKD